MFRFELRYELPCTYFSSRKLAAVNFEPASTPCAAPSLLYLTTAAALHAPPCLRHRDQTCSDRLFEDFPSVPNSSGLLVQADEGFLFPIVDLIKEDLPPPTVKS
ncbi:hypothetical protein F511_31515 [Dorcoceras hygrometricum]|uniref:Uncharacterized protein n=1 Tax=Dorcoceras hygrometricum TaxID=472368 RepID=A0A2Z7D6B8_9LAMI|nr:hypothetical protein F511_31515 [Dorcoceras hygrometricum]